MGSRSKKSFFSSTLTSRIITRRRGGLPCDVPDGFPKGFPRCAIGPRGHLLSKAGASRAGGAANCSSASHGKLGWLCSPEGMDGLPLPLPAEVDGSERPLCHTCDLSFPFSVGRFVGGSPLPRNGMLSEGMNVPFWNVPTCGGAVGLAKMACPCAQFGKRVALV